jgi:dTDP-4-amino-4,6-dideoxygalactose transaminase
MTIRMVDLERQRLALEPRVSQAMAAVVAAGAFVNGPAVRALEERLSDWLGGGIHTLACANGTDAIQILIRAAGIGPGDAVLVPSLTFVATAGAVALTGAVPVFCDVEPATGVICPDSVARTLAAVRAEGRLRPRAVIAVDLFAVPADYVRLSALCAAEGLRLFTDGAHSLGSETGGAKCCTQGDGAATSFYPSKALGCWGDGGAVFIRDPALAAAARSVAHHGTEGSYTNHVRVGTNSRLDTLQAAILLEKLAIYDAEVAARRRIGARYAAELGDVVTVPGYRAGDAPCWSYYAIRHPARDALAAHLADRGIPSVAYYKVPTHLQPGYAGFPRDPAGLAATEAWGASLLCLPLHPYLTDAEVAAVIAAVRSFAGMREAAE